MKTPQLFSCWGLCLGLSITIHPSDVIFPDLITRLFGGLFLCFCKSFLFKPEKTKHKTPSEVFFGKKTNKQTNTNPNVRAELIAETAGTEEPFLAHR